MIPKKKAKFVKSLHLKKFRTAENLFLVEGAKSVLELFNADFEVIMLLLTDYFAERYDTFLQNMSIPETYQISEKELSGLSTFKTNREVLAVVKQKSIAQIEATICDWILGLDQIQDPGNLGTIIRIADWFGITQIIATHTTAEFYNPKVIHASMGSFTRVDFIYVNLQEYLKSYPKGVFAASMNGENIHQVTWPSEGGMLLLGNESQGISDEMCALPLKKVTIPKFGKAESLNVAIAAGIILNTMTGSR